MHEPCVGPYISLRPLSSNAFLSPFQQACWYSNQISHAAYLASELFAFLSVGSCPSSSFQSAHQLSSGAAPSPARYASFSMKAICFGTAFVKAFNPSLPGPKRSGYFCASSDDRQ